MLTLNQLKQLERRARVNGNHKKAEMYRKMIEARLGQWRKTK